MIPGQYLTLRNICFSLEGEIGLHLQQFSEYFKATWMTGNWKCLDWCQFRKLNRTNSISEGNNSLLKKRLFFGDMSFYSVVTKLYSESRNLGLDTVFSYKPRQVTQSDAGWEFFVIFMESVRTTKSKRCRFPAGCCPFKNAGC